jgi:putative addiction module killer protein
MYEIKHYVNAAGEDIFERWRNTVKDSKATIAIDRRLYRVELGNFGDHKLCRDGVWELRIDLGPGYRIYYARAGQNGGLIAVRWHQALARCRYRAGMRLLARLAAR